MTRVWRLIKERHASSAFSGEGARIHGGRWNHEGTSAVYTSESLSLAVLETVIHLDEDERDVPFVYFIAEIPKKVPVKVVTVKELPNNWREEPPSYNIKSIGTDIFKAGAYAVIKIPSIIVPENMNYIINPLHKDYKKIKISDPFPYTLDQRI